MLTKETDAVEAVCPDFERLGVNDFTKVIKIVDKRKMGRNILRPMLIDMIELFQSVFNSVVRHHLLLENVGSGFWGFFHDNNLGESAAFAFLKACNGFLCHSL